MAAPQLSVKVLANLDALKASLQGDLEPILATTTRSLQQASAAFDGSKIISQAGAAVAAIEQLGGVATLTEKEQAKLNTTVNAAIDKYTALGKTAPAVLIETANATKAAEEQTSLFDASLGQLTAAFSLGGLITQGIGQITAFATEAIESAHKLETLAETTGLSTDQLQLLGNAAALTGGSLDSAVNGVEMLEQRLGKGDSGVVAAVTQLGLSMSDLRAMAPGDMFLAIADAVGHIEDPVQRAAVAAELFGRNWKTTIPEIQALIDGTAESIPKMSSATIEALSDLDKAWITLKQDLKVGVADIVGFFEAIAVAAKKAADVGSLGLTTLIAIPGQTKDMTAAAAAAQQYGKNLGLLPLQAMSVADAEAAMKARFGDSEVQMRANIKASDDYQKQVQALADVYTGKALAEKIQETTDALAKAETQGGLTAYQQQQLNKELVTFVQQGGQLPKALEDIYVAQGLWTTGLIGTNAELEKLIKAMPSVTLEKPWFNLSDAVKISTDSVKELLKFGGPDVLSQVRAQWEHDLVDPFHDLYSVLGLIEGAFAALGQAGDQWAAQVARDVGSAISLFHVMSGQMTSTGFSTGGTTQGKLQAGGEIATGAAGGIGSAINGNVGGALLGGAETGLGLATMAGASIAVGAATMGIGAGVMGAIALAKKLTASAGRDLVTQFASSMGGFDALHAKLDQLTADGTADGEKLWIALTQGVGKNNPDQAQAAIDAITTALTKDTDTASESLKTLMDNLSAAGIKVPATLDPMLSQLITSGDLKTATKDIGDLTGALTGYQSALGDDSNFQQIAQDAQSIGLAAGDMNATFKQGVDDASADQIAAQWQELLPYVNNADVLAQKYLKSAQQMVTDALTSGTSISSGMQPIIESLEKQGLLVDQNGDKLDDLSGVTFKDDPLTTALDKLNETLDLIFKNLLDSANPTTGAFAAFSGAGQKAAGDVGKAFDGIPTDIDVTVHAKGDVSGLGGGAGLDGVPVADAPIRAVTRGGLVRVNPGDIVGMPSRTPGYGASALQHIHVYLDGKEIAGFIVDTTNTAAAQGRIQIPSRAVTQRSPRG
jgi:hypothetical protein